MFLFNWINSHWLNYYAVNLTEESKHLEWGGIHSHLSTCNCCLCFTGSQDITESISSKEEKYGTEIHSQGIVPLLLQRKWKAQKPFKDIYKTLQKTKTGLMFLFLSLPPPPLLKNTFKKVIKYLWHLLLYSWLLQKPTLICNNACSIEVIVLTHHWKFWWKDSMNQWPNNWGLCFPSLMPLFSMLQES